LHDQVTRDGPEDPAKVEDPTRKIRTWIRISGVRGGRRGRMVRLRREPRVFGWRQVEIAFDTIDRRISRFDRQPRLVRARSDSLNRTSRPLTTRWSYRRTVITDLNQLDNTQAKCTFISTYVEKVTDPQDRNDTPVDLPVEHLARVSRRL
jgi:hypothetical protein